MEKKARRVCLLTAAVLLILFVVLLFSRQKPALSVHTAAAGTQDIYNSVTVVRLAHSGADSRALRRRKQRSFARFRARGGLR